MHRLGPFLFGHHFETCPTGTPYYPNLLHASHQVFLWHHPPGVFSKITTWLVGKMTSYLSWVQHPYWILLLVHWKTLLSMTPMMPRNWLNPVFALCAAYKDGALWDDCQTLHQWAAGACMWWPWHKMTNVKSDVYTEHRSGLGVACAESFNIFYLLVRCQNTSRRRG